MKTVLFTLLLALVLTIGCSAPTDTEEAGTIDESVADSIEQLDATEDASTAEEIGTAVGETARDVGDAVVDGAKKVGESAVDAAVGVVEGAKGEDAE